MLLIFSGVTIVALVLLSAGLSDLVLLPGRPLPRAKEAETLFGIGIGALPRNPLTDMLIFGLWIISLLLFPAAIVYFFVSKEARKQVFKMLALLLWLPALFILMRSRPDFWQREDVQIPELSPLEGVTPVEGFVASPPQWLIAVTAIGLGVLSAVIIVGAVWSFWRRRSQQPTSLQSLAQEAGDAIEALQAGADFKDTVMRCYHQMGQVLLEQKGLEREQAMTPREFERYLNEAGIPGEPVRRLTRLFEGVRYGDKTPDRDQEDQAIACLTFIVEACKSSP